MLVACWSKFWGRMIGRRSGLKGEMCRRLRSCMNVVSAVLQGTLSPSKVKYRLSNWKHDAKVALRPILLIRSYYMFFRVQDFPRCSGMYLYI